MTRLHRPVVDELPTHMALRYHDHGPCVVCQRSPKPCYGNHPFDAATRIAAPRACGSGSAVCQPPPKKGPTE